MYTSLLFLHSVLRWLVLASLVYSIYRSYVAYRAKTSFTKTDDTLRHWTATIAHIQLVVGFTLYIKSPVVSYFWSNSNDSIVPVDSSFFGWTHILLMLFAIVILTIGSAKAKRKSLDEEKFKTILIWFSLALVIILLAIPWPFSPLADRPYLRSF